MSFFLHVCLKIKCIKHNLHQISFFHGKGEFFTFPLESANILIHCSQSWIATLDLQGVKKYVQPTNNLQFTLFLVNLIPLFPLPLPHSRSTRELKILIWLRDCYLHFLRTPIHLSDNFFIPRALQYLILSEISSNLCPNKYQILYYWQRMTSSHARAKTEQKLCDSVTLSEIWCIGTNPLLWFSPLFSVLFEITIEKPDWR